MIAITVLRDETSEILGKIKENMKTGFRLQALRYEILNRLKRQRRLQHRLQLGIMFSCKTGRTVDHMPILGKWSQWL
jgi:hypothetical protein